MPIDQQIQPVSPRLEHCDGSRHRKILRIKSVIEQTGMSRSHIYHLSSKGLFPKSISLVPGGAAVGWLESEVQDWIEARIADRDVVTL